MHRAITVAFIVILGAASVAYATPPAAGGPEARKARTDPPDRMICRRFVRIGTLAGSDRVCKTRADWDRERANVRDFRVSESCHLNQASDIPGPCPQ